ncbi:hypothetical protein COCSUDRAFT_63412 [Coccomyxa subellipsoidea C-169]|uniref:Dickkopf N-terminal cysteine-rich domain-containing protein n=1 Tax=Coccomyxa subellipsoidea (strain C-169) TaxID=574566 RepID=I0YXB0_COCSC|nr:hypothetical protein COCSUDRAFT_63412 [Coccomyxa subellipsoidea C-169]EIE23029.1 hypothetical protein COCSUDRAFT_63412 [Coccomyxa subellipsoidea C-169]|eukprot:XP_005647573.1 hypothetical protein COCSUDRAFT_63412 [Coccomyxa subellipsoidea C-169]
MSPPRVGLKDRAPSASMALLLFLSASFLPASGQDSGQGSAYGSIADISGAQQAAYDAAAAGGGNAVCSDLLGNHNAVINGRCNGAGGCAVTDQAQAAMLCSPGDTQQPQCTDKPDRFLTCSDDVSLTAQQKGREVRVFVAMGTSLGSCMDDSECSTGQMCFGQAAPGICQPIAAGGNC